MKWCSNLHDGSQSPLADSKKAATANAGMCTSVCLSVCLLLCSSAGWLVARWVWVGDAWEWFAQGALIHTLTLCTARFSRFAFHCVVRFACPLRMPSMTCHLISSEPAPSHAASWWSGSRPRRCSLEMQLLRELGQLHIFSVVPDDRVLPSSQVKALPTLYSGAPPPTDRASEAAARVAVPASDQAPRCPAAHAAASEWTCSRHSQRVRATRHSGCRSLGTRCPPPEPTRYGRLQRELPHVRKRAKLRAIESDRPRVSRPGRQAAEPFPLPCTPSERGAQPAAQAAQPIEQ